MTVIKYSKNTRHTKPQENNKEKEIYSNRYSVLTEFYGTEHDDSDNNSNKVDIGKCLGLLDEQLFEVEIKD